MWQNISDGLKAMLQANTLIQEVYDWEASDFKGDPAVCLYPSANEGSYTTTTQNRRIYSFTIACFVRRGGNRPEQDTERIMRALVDSITDDVDKAYTGSGWGIAFKPGYAMVMVEATPSTWGYADLRESYRVATLEIRVHIEADVTVIT